ncbi:Glyoxylate/hydroxypyruvate reductase A [Bacillus sp. THAF10]|uniref:D-2-hydroxyacid dehydrogenase n=1 Tax=Bacillus sp. THAF10 TaxID=2587848 RepID=UPI00126856A3|nr:D-2-hydroxyacid dehydrogenase [Bacillus sp. THAF10]QFT91089.1 Glyoxylate/hydroxypyruvate reductase A [Bacillus sp. THAF10]
MKLENILFTGKIYKELSQLVPLKLQGKQLRFLSENNVTEKDLDWADAFVAFQPTRQFHFRHVKWVHALGAGVDRYLELPAWPADVLLTRTITSFGQKIGEYVLSYMLQNLQHHQRYADLQQQKEWKVVPPVSLAEKRVIIYGTGEIGQEVARMLSYFGVCVYGVSLSGGAKPHFKQNRTLSDVDDALLHEVDYVINTLPLTKETSHFYNEAFFAKLNGAVFINVGRGKSVATESLLRALDNENVARAVLDVFDEEPLASSSALWTHPNITITPHISAITTPEEAVTCFLDTLEKIEAGEPLTNRVDVKKGY